MGWLGSLFLLGSIYNLFVGDYLNTTAGISIGIGCFIIAFLWPHTEGKVSERAKIITLAIVPSLVLFYVATILLNEIEIGPEKYELLLEIKSNNSELKPLIMAAIKNGKVSIVEYYPIEKKFNQVRLEAVKNVLKAAHKLNQKACPENDPLGIREGNENCSPAVKNGGDPNDPLGIRGINE